MTFAAAKRRKKEKKEMKTRFALVSQCARPHQHASAFQAVLTFFSSSTKQSLAPSFAFLLKGKQKLELKERIRIIWFQPVRFASRWVNEEEDLPQSEHY